MSGIRSLFDGLDCGSPSLEARGLIDTQESSLANIVLDVRGNNEICKRAITTGHSPHEDDVQSNGASCYIPSTWINNLQARRWEAPVYIL